MVLDIIGENHRTRYGIKEEFHMTEECAMYLYEGIQTMNKIIEKLEKKIPKWIRNKLEETKSVLECFFHQDKKYVLHLKQDHDHRIILCASSRRMASAAVIFSLILSLLIISSYPSYDNRPFLFAQEDTFAKSEQRAIL